MSHATTPPADPPAATHREAPLALDSERFRELGHELVDRLAALLDSVPDRPVTPGEAPDVVRGLIDHQAPLPADGGDPATALRETAELLFGHSLFNGHPRFFGYITSSPAPIGMLADFLAAAVNPNVGGWTLSPLASEIEAQTVRWIAELIGYPADAGGLLVSGGNMANFVGFLAARRAQTPWDVRRAGMVDPEGRRLRVYGSAETHTWIQKATDLFGLGTDSFRWVPADGRQRMDTSALRRSIQEDRDRGDVPLMVVGTAGSVSTGAIDPLNEIADLCEEQGLWFHVDGAYGGFAAALPEADPDLRALSRADSVAVDPHKWLYAPLEAGCALVRDANALREAFSYHPRYYHFETETVNFVDYGPQNSRGFRALKVWLALRQAGREGYVRSIREDIRLAGRLHERVAEHPELEPATLCLSISTFRYVPPELGDRRGEPEVEAYLSRLNEELLDRIQRSGEAFVSNAVLGDRYLLRACIVNFNTAEADVDALPGIVVRLGREVHRELAPDGRLPEPRP